MIVIRLIVLLIIIIIIIIIIIRIIIIRKINIIRIIIIAIVTIINHNGCPWVALRPPVSSFTCFASAWLGQQFVRMLGLGLLAS